MTFCGAAIQGISTGKYHAAVMTNSEEWEVACVRAGRSSGDLAHPLVYCPELHFSEFTSAMADMKNSVAVSRWIAGSLRYFVFSRKFADIFVTLASPTGSWECPELLRRSLHRFPSGLWLAGCLGPRWHCISCACCKFLWLLQDHYHLLAFFLIKTQAFTIWCKWNVWTDTQCNVDVDIKLLPKTNTQHFSVTHRPVNQLNRCD